MANNELLIYGTIGASWWDEEYVTSRQVREQLAGISGDVIVRINSGGGIAAEGQAIYAALVDHPGKVTVVVDAVAASAAASSASAIPIATTTRRSPMWRPAPPRRRICSTP